MNQRQNVMGASAPPNAYAVGQPVRPGGPGMSPQPLGAGKRPGEMRAPNQTGKMYYTVMFLYSFILFYHHTFSLTFLSH